MAEDTFDLDVGRRGMSRQARFMLAMLVLIPTAAVVTAVTGVLQAVARSGQLRGAVVVVLAFGVLLLDVAVVTVVGRWWLVGRGGRAGLAAAEGVSLQVGTRVALLPWLAFDRVGFEGGALVGVLLPDSPWAADPMLARLRPRQVPDTGHISVVLGTPRDPARAAVLLATWFSPASGTGAAGMERHQVTRVEGGQL
ncbi:MAG: hypothetical protein HYR62_03420 [Actinobacteria bacterium]|nr:hypothetical protein [Actinomycetota bacterium]MBI3688880.1 hypothetical protein [Actinomycetota bacterium]